MSDARIAATQVENRVASYLRDEGWTIVTRRYKAGRGEIDIIALDGEVLVFVEVKSTRRDPEYARSALTADKIERMRVAAALYVQEANMQDRNYRFDLVIVGPERIERIADVGEAY